MTKESKKNHILIGRNEIFIKCLYMYIIYFFNTKKRTHHCMVLFNLMMSSVGRFAQSGFCYSGQGQSD